MHLLTGLLARTYRTTTRANLPLTPAILSRAYRSSSPVLLSLELIAYDLLATYFRLTFDLPTFTYRIQTL